MKHIKMLSMNKQIESNIYFFFAFAIAAHKAVTTLELGFK